MMGYVFLSVALLAAATKGFCGKKISGYTACLGDAVLANGIRMGMCVVIGLAVTLLSGDPSVLIPNAQLLWISALSGIATALFVVSWLLAVRKSAFMMVDIFLMLGVLVPLIASNLCFGEAVAISQWLGLSVVFVAVVLMCSYNNSIKEKMTVSTFLALLLCGVASGVADFSQKLFVKRIPNGSVAAFNFYTYLFAALVLTVAFLLTRNRDTTPKKVRFGKTVGMIAVMSVCIFVNTYCKVLAAERLNAVLLYPLHQGASLILATGMSAVLFKEKLTAKAVIGILLAFAGLLIISR